jgi:hypothetical protein
VGERGKGRRVKGEERSRKGLKSFGVCRNWKLLYWKEMVVGNSRYMQSRGLFRGSWGEARQKT